MLSLYNVPYLPSGGPDQTFNRVSLICQCASSRTFVTSRSNSSSPEKVEVTMTPKFRAIGDPPAGSDGTRSPRDTSEEPLGSLSTSSRKRSTTGEASETLAGSGKHLRLIKGNEVVSEVGSNRQEEEAEKVALISTHLSRINDYEMKIADLEHCRLEIIAERDSLLRENELLQSQNLIMQEQLHRDFHNTLENELSCVICSDVFIQPSVIECGHVFCYHCISSWITHTDGNLHRPTCPTCRVHVGRVQKIHFFDSYMSKLYSLLPEDVRQEREQVLRERREQERPRQAELQTRLGRLAEARGNQVNPLLRLLNAPPHVRENIDEEFRPPTTAYDPRSYERLRGVMEAIGPEFDLARSDLPRSNPSGSSLTTDDNERTTPHSMMRLSNSEEYWRPRENTIAGSPWLRMLRGVARRHEPDRTGGGTPMFRRRYRDRNFNGSDISPGRPEVPGRRNEFDVIDLTGTGRSSGERPRHPTPSGSGLSRNRPAHGYFTPPFRLIGYNTPGSSRNTSNPIVPHQRGSSGESSAEGATGASVRARNNYGLLQEAFQLEENLITSRSPSTSTDDLTQDAVAARAASLYQNESIQARANQFTSLIMSLGRDRRAAAVNREGSSNSTSGLNALTHSSAQSNPCLSGTSSRGVPDAGRNPERRGGTNELETHGRFDTQDLIVPILQYAPLSRTTVEGAAARIIPEERVVLLETSSDSEEDETEFY